MKIKTIFLFLIFTLPIAGCDWAEEKIAQHKAEKERKHQEAYEKSRMERIEWGKNNPIVGNLGGVPVSMPQYVIENLQYDDTPNPFAKEWKTYRRPEKRTYDDSVMSFGFVFDFKTSELREHWVNYRRWEKEKDINEPAHTWVDVGVSSGKEAPRIDMNEYVSTWLPKNGYNGVYKYHKTEDKYGLEMYEYFLDTRSKNAVNKEYKLDYDIFVAKNTDNNIVIVIKCSNYNKYNHLPCKAYFQIEELSSWIRMSFHRNHLEHWQRIQQIAEDHLRSWIVEPEKNSVVLK